MALSIFPIHVQHLAQQHDRFQQIVVMNEPPLTEVVAGRADPCRDRPVVRLDVTSPRRVECGSEFPRRAAVNPLSVRSAGFLWASSGVPIRADGILAAMTLTSTIRRLMLAVGAALLAGGSGAAAFPDARQEAIIGMAVGAGLLGFAIPRRRDRPDGGED